MTAKQELMKLANTAKFLQETNIDCSEMTINEILKNYIYKINEEVKTFSAWKKEERIVKKGEKGKLFFTKPMDIEKRIEKLEEEEKIVDIAKIKNFYGHCYLFGFSQTQEKESLKNNNYNQKKETVKIEEIADNNVVDLLDFCKSKKINDYSIENNSNQKSNIDALKIYDKEGEENISIYSLVVEEEKKEEIKEISSKSQTLKIVKEIKENNQDFEWYPTTSEIIAKVKAHTKNYNSVLDIGCGDGRVLKSLDICEKYGIEKSKILIKNCSSNISIIGADFLEQNLIDKDVDMIFCNPPYLDFKNWTLKIIKEAFCKEIFLVIPQRWKEDKEINEYIEKRGFKYKILDSFDFLNADRQARAKVDLVSIRGKTFSKNDPFDLFFEETFFIKTEAKEDYSTYKIAEKNNKNIKETIAKKTTLVKGDDYVKSLVEIYNLELEKILNNYKKIETLDTEIFNELQISLESVKSALKLKISGLKHLFWEELFKKFDKIKNKLNCSNSNKFLEKIRLKKNIDFNLSNIYAILIFVCKYSNEVMEQQIIDFFLDMANLENIKNYKSNQKTWKYDGWGYMKFKDDLEKVYLDYRIIVSKKENGLDNRRFYYGNSAQDFISDLRTNAINLGFQVNKINATEYGVNNEMLYYDNILEDWKLFAKIKYHKNGNIHIKFNVEFIKKLNIEVSRLKKWINTPNDACEEMNLSKNDVEKYFKSYEQLIDVNNYNLLLN